MNAESVVQDVTHARASRLAIGWQFLIRMGRKSERQRRPEAFNRGGVVRQVKFQYEKDGETNGQIRKSGGKVSEECDGTQKAWNTEVRKGGEGGKVKSQEAGDCDRPFRSAKKGAKVPRKESS